MIKNLPRSDLVSILKRMKNKKEVIEFFVAL